MKKYIVKLDNSYIKHTSKFGPFYGSIVTTDNKAEARLFSRERDAKELQLTILYRINKYIKDNSKFGHIKNISIEVMTL